MAYSTLGYSLRNGVVEMLVLRRLSTALPIAIVAIVTLLVGAVACGGEEEAPSRGAGRGAVPSGAGGEASSSPAEPAEGAKTKSKRRSPAVDVLAPVKERELPEAAFIETDENRDPFRSFLNVFAAQAIPEETTISARPPVLLEDVALDSLRLIAIVSGEGGNPRAMVVDPGGKGWVVRRGDYIGRGERIRLGPGQPEREINWRVVRVRPDRIILVREDPVQAGPPVTRVMRLYPEGEGSP